jgi:hypothetical protein
VTAIDGLAAHENTRQIKLHLEADVYICAIDSWTPPECEATVGDLIETRALSIGELLVSHRLLEAGRLLPEQTLPCGEVRALEECVFENTVYTSESSDDVDTIIIQLPELAIVTLRRPPEWVTAEQIRATTAVELEKLTV